MQDYSGKYLCKAYTEPITLVKIVRAEDDFHRLAWWNDGWRELFSTETS